MLDLLNHQGFIKSSQLPPNLKEQNKTNPEINPQTGRNCSKIFTLFSEDKFDK